MRERARHVRINMERYAYRIRHKRDFLKGINLGIAHIKAKPEMNNADRLALRNYDSMTAEVSGELHLVEWLWKTAKCEYELIYEAFISVGDSIPSPRTLPGISDDDGDPAAIDFTQPPAEPADLCPGY